MALCWLSQFLKLFLKKWKNLVMKIPFFEGDVEIHTPLVLKGLKEGAKKGGVKLHTLHTQYCQS